MSLDIILKTVQTSLPLAVVVAGYLINKKLNLSQDLLKRKTYLKQQIANAFYEKTLAHLDDISKLCLICQRHGISDIGNQNFKDEVVNAFANLMSSAREVEIYMELSQNTENVVEAVKSAEKEWRLLFDVLKGPEGLNDFFKLFESQKDVVSKLSEFYNAEILEANP